MRTCAVAGINLGDYSRTAAQRGWGSGWPQCDGVKKFKLVQVTADRSGTRITVNARVGRLVDMLMDATERRGYLFKPGKTGGNNCRPIGGTNRPSNHSWGLAADANWDDNPYTTTGKHDIPEWVYNLWARYGFANGGDYSGAKKDWMHFEFMGTPEQADRATDLAARELLVPGSLVKRAKEQEMSNGILPAARDGEFFFALASGNRSGLVSDVWLTLMSAEAFNVRWRWVGPDGKPISEYVNEDVPAYGRFNKWSAKEHTKVDGTTAIEGRYTSTRPVGWEIEKKPR